MIIVQVIQAGLPGQAVAYYDVRGFSKIQHP